MQPDLMTKLVERLKYMILQQKGFPTIRELDPLMLRVYAGGDDFRHGALSSMASLVLWLREMPQGREALANLGFEPVGQDVEGPGSAGPQD